MLFQNKRVCGARQVLRDSCVVTSVDSIIWGKLRLAPSEFHFLLLFQCLKHAFNVYIYLFVGRGDLAQSRWRVSDENFWVNLLLPTCGPRDEHWSSGSAPTTLPAVPPRQPFFGPLNSP